MPLFEIHQDEEISSIPSLDPDKHFSEEEIEELIWNFTDDLIGEGLLPIKRQAQITGNLIPDIVCLDRESNVVVVEVKKKIDRKQLAQAIEYGGWARGTSLDQLSSLYHAGAADFWKDLAEFTDSEVPTPLSGSPRIVLVSSQYAPKTVAGIRLLLENKVPITMVTVTLYQGGNGNRLVDVDIEGTRKSSDPAQPVAKDSKQPPNGISDEVKAVKIPDLLSSGLLEDGEQIEWHRPRSGVTYYANVLADGEIELENGDRASSPSGAATKAANLKAFDGWEGWAKSSTGETLHTLRERYAAGDVPASEDDEE